MESNASALAVIKLLATKSVGLHHIRCASVHITDVTQSDSIRA